MIKEGASVTSYMVAVTEMVDGPSGPMEGPVQVAETCSTLLEANALKTQIFMRPRTWRVWVERLEQKRVGHVMKKGETDGQA